MPATATATADRQAYAAFQAVHEEWRRSKEVAPPETWWQRLEGYCESLAEGRVEPAAQARATDVLDAYLLAAETIAAGDVELHPDREDTDAIAALESLMTPIMRAMRRADDAPPPRVESIEQLAKEEVKPFQIAKIWGVEEWLVIDILAGKAKLPEGHVPPAAREQQELLEARLAAYRGSCQRWRETMAGVFNTKAPVDDWKPPKESIRQLLAEGVNPIAIARDWRVSVEEVVAIRDGLVDPLDDDELAEDPPPAAAADATTLDDRIRALHLGEPHLTPKQLADELRCTVKQVNAALKVLDDAEKT